MTYKVFLAFGTDQRILANDLAPLLRQGREFEVFTDLLLSPGSNVSKDILNQLQNSDVLVFIKSEDSMAKDSYARSELDVFTKHRVALGKPQAVIPLNTGSNRYESCPGEVRCAAIPVTQNTGALALHLVHALMEVVKDPADRPPGWNAPGKSLIAVKGNGWTDDESFALARGIVDAWQTLPRNWRGRVPLFPAGGVFVDDEGKVRFGGRGLLDDPNGPIDGTPALSVTDYLLKNGVAQPRALEKWVDDISDASPEEQATSLNNLLQDYMDEVENGKKMLSERVSGVSKGSTPSAGGEEFILNDGGGGITIEDRGLSFRRLGNDPKTFILWADLSRIYQTIVGDEGFKSLLLVVTWRSGKATVEVEGDGIEVLDTVLGEPCLSKFVWDSEGQHAVVVQELENARRKRCDQHHGDVNTAAFCFEGAPITFGSDQDINRLVRLPIHAPKGCLDWLSVRLVRQKKYETILKLSWLCAGAVVLASGAFGAFRIALLALGFGTVALSAGILFLMQSRAALGHVLGKNGRNALARHKLSHFAGWWTGTEASGPRVPLWRLAATRRAWSKKTYTALSLTIFSIVVTGWNVFHAMQETRRYTDALGAMLGSVLSACTPTLFGVGVAGMVMVLIIWFSKQIQRSLNGVILFSYLTIPLAVAALVAVFEDSSDFVPEFVQLDRIPSLSDVSDEDAPMSLALHRLRDASKNCDCTRANKLADRVRAANSAASTGRLGAGVPFGFDEIMQASMCHQRCVKIPDFFRVSPTLMGNTPANMPLFGLDATQKGFFPTVAGKMWPTAATYCPQCLVLLPFSQQQFVGNKQLYDETVVDLQREKVMKAPPATSSPK